MAEKTGCDWTDRTGRITCDEPIGRNIDGEPTSDGRCAVHSSDPHKDPAPLLAVIDSMKSSGHLDGASFAGQASFERARLSAGSTITFGGTRFLASPSFASANFEGTAVFDRALFGRGAVFSGCTLSAASFRESTFGGPTSFENSYWRANGVDFGAASFLAQAVFDGISSDRDAAISFQGTRFQHVSFCRSRFRGPISLDRTEIEGDADFTQASFEAAPTFYKTTFRGGTLFEHVTFEVQTPFDETRFGPACSFARTNVRPLIFHRAEMSGVCLARAYEIALAEYDGAAWGRLPGSWRGAGPAVIWEEQHARETQNILDYETARHVYAELRRSLEAHKDLAQADNFAARELEMRRLSSGRGRSGRVAMWSWVRRNLLSFEAWYLYLAGYGRSWVRPILWLFLILYLFALLYAALGASLSGGGGSGGTRWLWQEGAGEGAADLIALSLRTAALVPEAPGTIQPAAVQIVQIFERIAGPFLAFLFGLAVRRHFRR